MTGWSYACLELEVGKETIDSLIIGMSAYKWIESLAPVSNRHEGEEDPLPSCLFSCREIFIIKRL